MPLLLREKIECKYCGKEFKPKRRTNLFCSKKCSQSIRMPDLSGVTLTCPCCSQRFTPWRSNQVYCSKTCQQLYNLKRTETLHIPHTVFQGTREEIVAKLEQWLETKGYFRDS